MSELKQRQRERAMLCIAMNCTLACVAAEVEAKAEAEAEARAEVGPEAEFEAEAEAGPECERQCLSADRLFAATTSTLQKSRLKLQLDHTLILA